MFVFSPRGSGVSTLLAMDVIGVILRVYSVGHVEKLPPVVRAGQRMQAVFMRASRACLCCVRGSYDVIMFRVSPLQS